MLSLILIPIAVIGIGCQLAGLITARTSRLACAAICVVIGVTLGVMGEQAALLFLGDAALLGIPVLLKGQTPSD